MKREQALAKNTIILTIGKFLPQIFNLITLPLITGKLTSKAYGTYDLVTTLVALLLPIATMQIQSAAFRYLLECRDDEKQKKTIITNIMVFTIPISIIVLLIFFFVLSDVDVLIRVLICLYFFADTMTLTIGQVARGLSMNKVFAMSAILLSVVNTIVIVATLSFKNMGLVGVLLAAAISNVVSTLYLIKKTNLFKYISRSSIDKDNMKQLLKYSLPMVPNNLSSWVLRISDRLVITWALGIEANAIYAVANKIPNILTIAKSTFIMAWQENASIVSKDEDATAYYSKMFDMIYSFIIGITALLIAFTPIMFMVLIRGNYDEAYAQMPILFLGIFFSCISAFQGGIYIAYMKTKSVGISTTVVAMCNLIIDFALVNSIGIYAGSISTLISYMILFLYRMFDVKKIQNIEYNMMKLIVQFLVVVVMSVLCYMRIFALDCVNMVIGIAFFFIVNREMITSTLKTLKRRKG